MRLIFYLTIFGGDASQQYDILDPVPFCECNQDEQWGSWQGCDQACSDEPIKQLRSRTCEGKKPMLFDPNYCPSFFKKYYVQEQYRICDSIPLCGELNKLEFWVEIIFSPAYWSEWEDTSPCSKSCGMGKKNQKRYCERGKQKVNISACEGKNTRKQNCNNQRCRESKFKFWRLNSNYELT